MTQELSQVNQDIKLLHAALQRLDIHGLTTGDLKSYSLIEVDINQDYKNWVRANEELMLSFKSRLPALQQMKTFSM